jgi:superfamily II DNA helicase RecQ
MALYLVYIQPFREYLTLQVLQGNYTDYVWSDAQGPWETDRLTRVLKRETAKRLGVKLHTLDYRHTAVGIGREKVGQTFSKGYDDDVGEVEEEEVDDNGEDIVELQNSRTTSMGIGNYAVPIDIVKHLSVRSIDAFRPLSMLWHRFLGVDGKAGGRRQEERAEERPDARKRRLGDGSFETALQPRDREVRVNTTRESDVCRAMQRIFKTQNVGFRSVEQELAVHAVLDKQTPLVVVLPTGGGKSLLFMVPGCVEEGGMTVVVVPYRALITDLVTRIRGSGIECIEWKHGETNPASVVVVSADIAGDILGDGNFLSYARLLCSKGVLRRVVVDECHLIYTSSDWRPKLAGLKNLRLLPCPIVLLTATLPPLREHELASAMLFTHVTYIRASTVRPNTQYFVSWCERDKLEETAITIRRRRQRELLAKGEKGVVYCQSKQRTEAIAEMLGCEYYHAGIADRAERLAEWIEKGGLVVATSALGTGVDIAGVVYILHVGMPWSMTDFAQESGRGGRDGETVDAVILVAQGEVERRLQQKSDDIDVLAMGAFITDSGCRRALMSGYLDGKGVTCSDIEAAGCDRCGDGVRKWMEEKERHSREWQKVREQMDELRRGCAICWVLGQCEDKDEEEAWRGHRTMQCNRDAEVNTQVVDRFRQKIRDGGGGHSCRRCWISQKYCATGEKWENTCQWPNVVIPVAYAAMATEEGQRVVQRLGFRGGDMEGYAKWLGTRHKERVWGEFFSNAMVVGIRVILWFLE